MPTLTEPRVAKRQRRTPRAVPEGVDPHDPHKAAREEAIKQAVDYIKLNYIFDIKLIDVVKRVPYSYWHFQRAFHKKVGMTIGHYIRACRLEQAKHLLTKTDMLVADICVAVGYTSVGTFSTVFKKVVGSCPTDYRTLAREKTNERSPSTGLD